MGQVIFKAKAQNYQTSSLIKPIHAKNVGKGSKVFQVSGLCLGQLNIPQRAASILQWPDREGRKGGRTLTVGDSRQGLGDIAGEGLPDEAGGCATCGAQHAADEWRSAGLAGTEGRGLERRGAESKSSRRHAAGSRHATSRRGQLRPTGVDTRHDMDGWMDGWSRAVMRSPVMVDHTSEHANFYTTF